MRNNAPKFKGTAERKKDTDFVHSYATLQLGCWGCSVWTVLVSLWSIQECWCCALGGGLNILLTPVAEILRAALSWISNGCGFLQHHSTLLRCVAFLYHRRRQLYVEASCLFLSACGYSTVVSVFGEAF